MGRWIGNDAARTPARRVGGDVRVVRKRATPRSLTGARLHQAYLKGFSHFVRSRFLLDNGS
jgi:hypothetical protein